MNLIKIAALLVLVSIPSISQANHNGTRSYWNDLDKDIVKKIKNPILFGVDYENINPDFGDPRGDGTRSHEGEDILAPQGTPIVSPTKAIVIKTGSGSSAGKYVYTANPGGETFRYMHLDSFGKLKAGDKLDVGDFIGTVGDTGNAPDGAYHLHFEVRDKDNKPQDPYERIDEDNFTLKKKVSFLNDIFKNIHNDNDYAEFLVDSFGDELRTALSSDYDLPRAITEALEDTGVVSDDKALEQLGALIGSLPAALDLILSEGDQGAAVSVLQLYLIYGSEGPARDILSSYGPTGYYGLVTKNALSEYQKENLAIENKGTYDGHTRLGMMKRDSIKLNLN